MLLGCHWNNNIVCGWLFLDQNNRHQFTRFPNAHYYITGASTIMRKEELLWWGRKVTE